MKVIIPYDFGVMDLVSSSIPETDHPEWSASATYSRGDFVISVLTHTVYRSLTDNNSGNDPDIEQAALADPLIDDPATVHWQVIGATNRWRMFDKKPSVQARADGSIEVVIHPNRFATGIGGFNLDAARVSVEVVDNGVLEYSRTVALSDETVVGDWFSYFFTPILPLKEFALTDLPPFASADLKVTIEGGGSIGVGQIVIGEVREIGSAGIGNTGFNGFDFSLVQQDEFGDLTTVRRAATRLSTFDVFLSSYALSSFDSLMRDLRGGTAAVWIGDDDSRKAALNYGFYRDYRVIYTTAEYSVVSMQIQGIV